MLHPPPDQPIQPLPLLRRNGDLPPQHQILPGKAAHAPEKLQRLKSRVFDFFPQSILYLIVYRLYLRFPPIYH